VKRAAVIGFHAPFASITAGLENMAFRIFVVEILLR
jgi:hypothetical protein